MGSQCKPWHTLNFMWIVTQISGLEDPSMTAVALFRFTKGEPIKLLDR